LRILQFTKPCEFFCFKHDGKIWLLYSIDWSKYWNRPKLLGIVRSRSASPGIVRDRPASPKIAWSRPASSKVARNRQASLLSRPASPGVARNRQSSSLSLSHRLSLSLSFSFIHHSVSVYLMYIDNYYICMCITSFILLILM